ncbi:MAG TPA: DUF2849 domain-containing protein [Rhizobiaceae bacterium]|nr:DUF2849 domain-containing protein [Rhizobiaceae bacterium]
MATKKDGAKVLTANRLTDGIAVWLGAGGAWVEHLDGAFIARHAEAVAALEETARHAQAHNLVLDIAVVDIEERDGRPYPLRLRERIRAEGPTVRRDLGKQAQDRAAMAA